VNPTDRTGERLRVRFESLAPAGTCKGTPAEAPGTLNVYADFAAPGDIADVVLTSAKKRYAEAEIVEIVEASPLRAEPRCPLFGRCGGCRWQHLNDEAQRAAKTDIVRFVLRRAGFADVPVDEIVHSPDAYGYRRRAEPAVERTAGGTRFGFRERAGRGIVDVEACPILEPWLSAALPRVRRAVESWPILAGDRRCEIVGEAATGRVAVLVSTKPGDPELPPLLIDTRAGAWGAVEQPPAFELAESGIAFTPGAFVQVNPAVNALLVGRVVEAAAPAGKVVLELFAGVGNFTFPLVAGGARITAVESDPAAVRDARRNAARLNADLEVVGRDVHGAMNTLDRAGKRFDVVLVDPPRAGLGRRLVEAIARREPERVVYVSCNPESLTDDLRVFAERGLRPTRVTPFDMFPQTEHIETLAVIDRM
jgi:23S rRNA (uracil1939-C5)-methyltransferase